MYTIYLITCLINNKKYIGVTKNSIKTRFIQHISDAKRSKLPLHKCIKKYGKNNFKIEILENIENEDLAYETEKYYIKKYQTLKPDGYNLIEGGKTVGIDTYQRKTKSEIKEIRKRGAQNRMKYFTPEFIKIKVKQLNDGNKKISRERRSEFIKKGWILRRNKYPKTKKQQKKELLEKLLKQPISGMCQYCKINTGMFRLKGGQICCKKHYLGCPEVKKKAIISYKKTMDKLSKEIKVERAKNAWKNISKDQRSIIAKKSRATYLKRLSEKNKESA